MDNNKCKPPKYLYNYGSIDERERVKQVLLENKWWFSNPTRLNDPFEFRPWMCTGQTFGEKDAFNRWVRISFGKNQSKKSNKAILQRIRKNPQILRDFYCSRLIKYGIYCFTERPDSILMWAYYGKGHTGYCLKFNTEHAEILNHVAPVHYSNEYPTVRLYQKSPEEWSRESILTKSKEWSHEYEWRLFSKEIGNMDIPAGVLEGIILGCKMQGEHRSKIINWCDKRELPIQKYETVLDEREYKINIKPILKEGS